MFVNRRCRPGPWKTQLVDKTHTFLKCVSGTFFSNFRKVHSSSILNVWEDFFYISLSSSSLYCQAGIYSSWWGQCGEAMFVCWWAPQGNQHGDIHREKPVKPTCLYEPCPIFPNTKYIFPSTNYIVTHGASEVQVLLLNGPSMGPNCNVLPRSFFPSLYLVGGWTNPSEKYASKWEPSTSLGLNIKKMFETTI